MQASDEAAERLHLLPDPPLLPVEAVDGAPGQLIDLVLLGILNRRHQQVWDGTRYVLLIDDPAHAKVAASLCGVQVAEMDLSGDLGAPQSPGQAVPHRLVLGHEPLLNDSEYPVGHLEELLSGQGGEVIGLCRYLSLLLLFA